MTRWRLGFTLAALLSIVTQPLPATVSESLVQTDQGMEGFARLLRENRRVVSGDDQTLAGAGFEFLVREGAASEFFLVGESHNMAEIPQLTRQLASALRGHGYAALAIEIGPRSAVDLVARLEHGGLAAQREFAQSYPFTLPFFENRGETELLQGALEAGYAVWGLDQEFVGSGRYFLDLLAGLAPDQATRELVAAWQARELEAALHFQRTQSTEKAMLLTGTQDEFDELRAAFEAGAEPSAESADEALEIIEALATSSRIYQLWRPQNYENNRQRVDYLKGNLVARMRAWEADHGTPPKVLLKFGSVHTVRGRTVTNQFDLGNLGLQLAVVRGGRSFHLWTTALGMLQADGSVSDWRSDEPGWQLIYDLVDPDQPWTIIDLRELRPWFHRDSNRVGNENLAEMVFQHDAVAIAPQLRAAEPLVQGS